MAKHSTDSEERSREQQNPTPDETAGADQTDPEALRQQLQRALDERDHFRDQALRTMADFQNFRKRVQNESSQVRQLAAQGVVSDLLPVLDNFERTISHLSAGSSIESVIEGVRAVERQLRSILELHNVRRMQSVGEPFDPELHEAIGTVDTDEQEHETVVEEVEPGYRMGDKVIRPARVRIAKRP